MKITITEGCVVIEDMPDIADEHDSTQQLLQMVQAMTWGMHELAEATAQLTAGAAMPKVQETLARFRLGVH